MHIVKNSSGSLPAIIESSFWMVILIDRIAQLGGLMPRLFAGLEIPYDVGQMLAGLRGGLPGARWVEPSDYHITLRFIGDISNRLASDIDSMLADVSRSPVPVRLSGLGSFGGDKPHSVYAQVEPTRQLGELQAEVERLIRACGVAVDKRRFQPHVTLARLRGSSARDVADYLSMRGYFPSQNFTLDRFALFSSRASSGGGPYIVETTYPLRHAALAASASR
jgi:RNA 2',3'-cyclic 3'-phosphodiesterase